MLKELLLAQRDRGAAVVMSTHDMEDAQVLCDRIVLIDKGRRLLYGQCRRGARAFSDGAVEVVGKNLPSDATSADHRQPCHRLRRLRALPAARRPDRAGSVPRAGRDTGDR